MTKLITLILGLAFGLVTFGSHQASASGCLGGHWLPIEKKLIDQRSVVADKVEISSQIYGQFTYLTLSNLIYTDPGKIEKPFTMRTSFPNTEDLDSILSQLEKAMPKLKIDIIEVTETNTYYDDCDDIPAGSLRTYIDKTFVLELDNGKRIRF